MSMYIYGEDNNGNIRTEYLVQSTPYIVHRYTNTSDIGCLVQQLYN